MSIQKKSLLSELKTAKKANVASAAKPATATSKRQLKRNLAISVSSKRKLKSATYNIGTATPS